MKIFCKLFWHNFVWVLAFEEIRCKRCGLNMGKTIAEWIQVYGKDAILKSV